MINYKKITISIILSSMLCLIFAGCRGNDSAAGSSEGKTDSVQNASVAATPTNAENERTGETFSSEYFTAVLPYGYRYDDTSADASDPKILFYYFLPADSAENGGASAPVEHITVVRNDMSESGRDFDVYKDMLSKQLASGNCTIHTSEDLTINGYSSYRTEYQGTLADGTVYYCYMVSMNVENIIYSYTLTAYDEGYKDKTLQIDLMAESALYL